MNAAPGADARTLAPQSISDDPRYQELIERALANIESYGESSTGELVRLVGSVFYRALADERPPAVETGTLEARLESAERRAEYWKAEHLAANAEIERLRPTQEPPHAHGPRCEQINEDHTQILNWLAERLEARGKVLYDFGPTVEILDLLFEPTPAEREVMRIVSGILARIDQYRAMHDRTARIDGYKGSAERLPPVLRGITEEEEDTLRAALASAPPQREPAEVEGLRERAPAQTGEPTCHDSFHYRLDGPTSAAFCGRCGGFWKHRTPSATPASEPAPPASLGASKLFREFADAILFRHESPEDRLDNACDALARLTRTAPPLLAEAERAIERLDARRDEDVQEWAERLGADIAATPSDRTAPLEVEALIDRFFSMRMPEGGDEFWRGWNSALTNASNAVREATTPATTARYTGLEDYRTGTPPATAAPAEPPTNEVPAAPERAASNTVATETWSYLRAASTPEGPNDAD